MPSSSQDEMRGNDGSGDSNGENEEREQERSRSRGRARRQLSSHSVLTSSSGGQNAHLVQNAHLQNAQEEGEHWLTGSEFGVSIENDGETESEFEEDEEQGGRDEESAHVAFLRASRDNRDGAVGSGSAGMGVAQRTVARSVPRRQRSGFRSKQGASAASHQHAMLSSSPFAMMGGSFGPGSAPGHHNLGVSQSPPSSSGQQPQNSPRGGGAGTSIQHGHGGEFGSGHALFDVTRNTESPPLPADGTQVPDAKTPLLGGNYGDPRDQQHFEESQFRQRRRSRRQRKKAPKVDVFGIAALTHDPKNESVEWTLFRYALRFCGMNPFARVLTWRHVALKILVAACVSCMIPWLWFPTIRRGANFVELETTFEWVAAVWMVLYGFSYWRNFHTLRRLLSAIRTDEVATRFVDKLARRYQIFLCVVWTGALLFYALAEFEVMQPTSDRAGNSTVEYIFAAVGIPSFVLVFATVFVWYCFICHLHLIHIRRCRHLMGSNLLYGGVAEFEKTRSQVCPCLLGKDFWRHLTRFFFFFPSSVCTLP
jgi:hypothetical protein